MVMLAYCAHAAATNLNIHIPQEKNNSGNDVVPDPPLFVKGQRHETSVGYSPGGGFFKTELYQ